MAAELSLFAIRAYAAFDIRCTALSLPSKEASIYVSISERLENDRENVLSDLPVFYTIEGNKITRLSKQDSLYKMYPEIKRIEEGKRQGEEAAI